MYYSEYDLCSSFLRTGGPADCSTTSVILQCRATSAENEATSDFLITVFTDGSLICVKEYQIEFNEENKSISLESPMANFVINDVSDGQPLLNEIIVYTIGFQNETGKVPCNFNIPGELISIHDPLYQIALIFRGSKFLQISRIWNCPLNYFSKKLTLNQNHRVEQHWRRFCPQCGSYLRHLFQYLKEVHVGCTIQGPTYLIHKERS